MKNNNPRNDFNIFLGAHTGLLKGVNINPKHVIVKNCNKITNLEKGWQITSLAWGDDEEIEVLVGHANQTVRVFDTECKAFTSSREANYGNGPFVGIARWNGTTVTGVKSGHVTAWRHEDPIQFRVLQPRAISLSCLKQNPSSHNLFATGGEESDLQIWDLENPNDPVFAAKNVRNDILDLRVPVWVSDAAFMQDNRRVGVVTRHKQVRLYDPVAQRRPVLNFEFEDSPLTSICTVPHVENQVIVGSAHGRMALIDLRGNMAEQQRRLGVFKGFAGAVRDIVVHKELPLVFSASLDRFLRVHHLHTRKLIHAEYVKSRLNCVLVRSDGSMNSFQPPDNNNTTAKKRKRNDGTKNNDEDDLGDIQVIIDSGNVASKMRGRKHHDDED